MIPTLTTYTAYQLDAGDGLKELDAPVAVYLAGEVDALLEPLIEIVRGAKREHDDGEAIDCPMAHPDYAYNKGEPCTCGADAWNAKIDAALNRL